MAAGYETTVLVRRPDAIAASGPKLRVVRGDVTNAVDVRDATAGADALISAVGSHEMGRPTTIYSAGAAAAIEGMQGIGVRRFIAISAVPVIPADLKESVESLRARPAAAPVLWGRV